MEIDKWSLNFRIPTSDLDLLCKWNVVDKWQWEHGKDDVNDLYNPKRNPYWSPSTRRLSILHSCSFETLIALFVCNCWRIHESQRLCWRKSHLMPIHSGFHDSFNHHHLLCVSQWSHSARQRGMSGFYEQPSAHLEWYPCLRFESTSSLQVT